MQLKYLGFRRSFQVVGDSSGTIFYLDPSGDGKAPGVRKVIGGQRVTLPENVLITSVMSHEVDYDRI